MVRRMQKDMSELKEYAAEKIRKSGCLCRQLYWCQNATCSYFVVLCCDGGVHVLHRLSYVILFSDIFFFNVEGIIKFEIHDLTMKLYDMKLIFCGVLNCTNYFFFFLFHMAWDVPHPVDDRNVVMASPLQR